MPNAPERKFKIGLITATVWLNDGFYSVTFSRAYKNGDDWKSTDGFTAADLPVVEKLAARAEAWIAENPAQ